MMFGEVIGVKARAIVSLGEFEPPGEQLTVRHARIVQVIEHAEFHGWNPPDVIPGRGL